MCKWSLILFVFLFFSCSDSTPKAEAMEKKETITLINLAPGHFHASLVQKNKVAGVDDKVYVYAPDGPELNQYLKVVNGFNTRAEQPTFWQQEVYKGDDFLEKMAAQKPGEVVLISGNNEHKTEYINRSIEAGINVLADKPMVIDGNDFSLLLTLFAKAKEKGILLYKPSTESQRAAVETALKTSVNQLAKKYEGLGLQAKGEEWELEIPAVFRVGHEAHFGEVMSKYLEYLKEGNMPAWEVPNMISKYHTTVKALELAKE